MNTCRLCLRVNCTTLRSLSSPLDDQCKIYIGKESRHLDSFSLLSVHTLKILCDNPSGGWETKKKVMAPNEMKIGINCQRSYRTDDTKKNEDLWPSFVEDCSKLKNWKTKRNRNETN